MATYDLTSSIPAVSSLAAGDILNCPYSGAKKEITLPKGKYKLEVWGAQGGYRSNASYGGKGGYSYGTITLNQPTTVYLYAGGFPGNTTSNAGSTKTRAGGFNGGGSRYGYYGGGGGSDIRIGQDSLYARVIVAGGGGSDGATNKTGMYGGGTSGGSASQSYGSGGGGGTQTAGGTGGSGNAGSFGQGGQGKYASNGYAGAGGGGWYGGGGSYPDSSGDDDRGGGGGSGYILTSSSSKPSGYLLGSEYYLTDAIMYAGNASFTDYSGSTVTGHSGHGACRITAIEVIQDSKGNKNLYLKTNEKGSLPSEYIELPYIESTGDQYINTGITGHSGLTVDLKFAVTVPPVENNIMGSCNSGYTNRYYPMSFNDGNFNYGYGDNYKSIKPAEQGVIYNSTTVLEVNKQSMLVNDMPISYSTNAGTIDNGVEMILFGINVDGSPLLTPAKIYYCKIFENNTLIRNFIPALRRSDGKAGMYDTVYKTFYDSGDENNNFIYNNNAFLDEHTIYYIKGNDVTTNLGNSGTITNNNVVATPNDLLYFNGTNSELKLSSNITVGTSDWTVDWWDYETEAVANSGVYHNASRFGLLLGYTTNGNVVAYASSNNSSWDIFSGTKMGTVKLNEWVHRAVCRKGSNFYFFENGKLINTVSSSASILNPGDVYIGRYYDGTNYHWKGYLKHFRVSNCARWTSDFTPPSLEMGYGTNYAKITESYIKVPKDQTAFFDSNYYPLKYIESSGTQYIDTNFIPNQNSSIEIIFENQYFDSIKGFFGGREGTSAKSFSAWINGKTFYPHYGNISYSGFPISIQENINKYNLNKNYANVKETSQIITAATFTSPCSLTIFGVNTNGTVDERRAIGKMYSCKIWDNGTLVRDYVPALRKSDNIAGLYDKVNNVFYVDATGNNFIYNTLDIDNNTKLLLNGTLTDASNNNTITNTNTQIMNVGNTNILYFNGNALINTNNYNYVSGTNDFTVEWWEYPLAFTSGAGVFQAGTDYGGLLLAYQNGTAGDLRAYAGSNTSTWDIFNGIAMGTMKLNQWTHRAISRHGNNFYFFENGKLINTASGSGSINATKQQIGGYTYSDSTKYFQGYIDGFRISACARWANDFIPPKRYGNPWKKIESIYLKTNNPSGYTRLEYLESTGTQYTDTGLIPNQNTKTVIDCILPTTSSGSYYICGARQESYVGNYSLQTTGGMYYSKHGTADVSLSIPSIEHRMKFIKDGHVFSVDGNLGYNTPVDFTSPNSMYIFACNSAGSIYGLTPCKIYRVQIYQDGTNLSRDMVPVLRNSDGKTGFYDLVNSKFYPNLDTTAEFNFIYSNGWEKIT